MPGASAIDCPNASTTAISRSRRLPPSDGIGAGGIRPLKAAASNSFPLGKWRYRVARATLAPRVTASTVTALGPPVRSKAVAASSNRARERAGRGSVLSVMVTTSFIRSGQPTQSACPARYRPRGDSADELRGPMPQHRDGGVRAAAGDGRQHRPVDHPQPVDTVHAALVVDDCQRIPDTAHRRGATQMLRRRPTGITDLRCRADYFASQIAAGLQCRDVAGLAVVAMLDPRPDQRIRGDQGQPAAGPPPHLRHTQVRPAPLAPPPL